ncbi:MAG: hypothetical protein A2Y17_04470 [Clostridiales bacterium GWF2_38_85]|nr:MAG: hypothetical protein A2Y17_04470 [Clostridiales bacterium GWF2_38_85]HBL83393.1 hypothetical protein [Clostridiales bacterium]
MKRKTKIILIICAIIIVIISVAVFQFIKATNESMKQLEVLTIENVDLSEVADGEYNGKYELFPVTVEVNVTIKDHKITKIDILKHDNGKGQPAEAITDAVVSANSLEVDTISGATMSSKVILKAIENALADTN